MITLRGWQSSIRLRLCGRKGNPIDHPIVGHQTRDEPKTTLVAQTTRAIATMMKTLNPGYGLWEQNKNSSQPISILSSLLREGSTIWPCSTPYDTDGMTLCPRRRNKRYPISKDTWKMWWSVSRIRLSLAKIVRRSHTYKLGTDWIENPWEKKKYTHQQNRKKTQREMIDPQKHPCGNHINYLLHRRMYAPAKYTSTSDCAANL